MYGEMIDNDIHTNTKDWDGGGLSQLEVRPTQAPRLSFPRLILAPDTVRRPHRYWWYWAA